MRETSTADLHIHSTFSVDGSDTLMAMAGAAWQSGLRTICFTEHVDYNPRDSGFGYYDYDAYSEAVKAAREAFADRLEILWGIEFSAPHLYPAEFEREQSRGYDMIIGSQHFLGQWFFGEPEMLEAYTRVGIFDRYFEELLTMTRTGGFDVMGHIGFPSRYIGEHPMLESQARALAELLSGSGIVPEINTSGFRKGYLKTMPEESFLRIYREQSDGRVTTGSDAHRVGDLGAGLEHAENATRTIGLTPVVFRQRKAVP